MSSKLLERLASAKFQAEYHDSPKANSKHIVQYLPEAEIFLKYPTYDSFRKSFIQEYEQKEKSKTVNLNKKSVSEGDDDPNLNQTEPESFFMTPSHHVVNTKENENSINIEIVQEAGKVLFDSGRKYSDKKNKEKIETLEEMNEMAYKTPQKLVKERIVYTDSDRKLVQSSSNNIDRNFDDEFSTQNYISQSPDKLPEAEIVNEKKFKEDISLVTNSTTKMFLDFKKLRKEAAEKVKAFKKQVSENDTEVQQALMNSISEEYNDRPPVVSYIKTGTILSKEEVLEKASSMPLEGKALIEGLVYGFRVRAYKNSKAGRDLRKDIMDLYGLINDMCKPSEEGHIDTGDYRESMKKQILKEICLKKEEYVDLLNEGPSEDLNESMVHYDHADRQSIGIHKSYLKRKSQKIVASKPPDWTKVQPKTQTRRQSLSGGTNALAQDSKPGFTPQAQVEDHASRGTNVNIYPSAHESHANNNRRESLGYRGNEHVKPLSSATRRESLGYHANERIKPPTSAARRESFGYRGKEQMKPSSLGTRRDSIGIDSPKLKQPSKISRRTEHENGAPSLIQPPFSSAARRLSGIGTQNQSSWAKLSATKVPHSQSTSIPKRTTTRRADKLERP